MSEKKQVSDQPEAYAVRIPEDMCPEGSSHLLWAEDHDAAVKAAEFLSSKLGDCFVEYHGDVPERRFDPDIPCPQPYFAVWYQDGRRRS